MRKSGKTQAAVYEFIKLFIEENAYPPTVREIGAAVGLKSTSTVHAHLNNLAEKGMIAWNRSKQRSITLTERKKAPARRLRSVPLVGSVAAGQPILAEDNIQDYCPLPASMLRGAGENEVFMLRVQGVSMIEAGINDGDLIVVHRGMAAGNGDIVVARVARETATVKRFFIEKDNMIRLQPENHEMQPIFVEAEEVEIIGKLIGLYRQY